ncbi:DUF955 domain protein [Campylobacter avium LMG 24591]|uniref:DUF955 domain protein n=1 Tax=Campylobacter avium LMG 24591 TaxID=522484 RepID=A0A222MXA9_9BACT|nr:ImmA/IrrE family metallo-endopeptidase [Campylobacter avium]ASQ30232.1 DUF955 domain protein [Campylobacter avium LMG 24591]OYD79330.1 hypothetical protein CAV8706_0567 [Campylobacter avium]
MNEAKIIAKADEARKLTNQLFPIDPILIAKAMGLKVFTASLPRDVSGEIFYKEKKIFIEQTDYITRQVFSVAHELGHYILHNDGTSHISKRDTTSSQGIDIKEIEANFFAANLLMPQDEVLRLTGLKFTLDSMASYFNVSPLAMQYRLEKLGISAYV